MVMSEFAPILISLVIRLLVSLILLGLPFLFASNSSSYPIKPIFRRFRKKVFLLGKHGTLIFKKSMPFLFVATVSSLFDLLCLKLGSMDFFHYLISKIGFSLGSRVLLSRGLGCEGWLLLVLILAAFGIFDGTILNMTGGNDTVNQGPHRGDAGPSSIQNDESDSESWRKYLNCSSSTEGNAAPEPSTDRTPGHLPQGGGAPGQPAWEREPEAPTIDEFISQMKLVLRGHRMLRSDVLKKIQEDIRLETASPQKRIKMNEYLDYVSNNRESL